MISFRPWRLIQLQYDRTVTRRFLRSVADESKTAFEQGILKGPQTGSVGYRKGGGRFLRSAPGQWPARDSGRLLKSIRTRANATEATIGTTMYYAKWLREGSKRMQRRKMSDDAIRLGANASRNKLKGWVKFAREK